MKFGSVCSGIEAASVAWEPLGWKAQWFSEIDPYSCALLEQRYPDVPNLGDMCNLTERFREEPTTIDVLVGGTPCQSFSVAGFREGLDDDRGNLAFEFIRIVDEVRPRWVVWENVPGVFSSISHRAPDPRQPEYDLESEGGSGVRWKTDDLAMVVDEYEAIERHSFGCFLATLSELGYGYCYRVFDAQYFGVPQRRKRVFVVGYLGDWRPPTAALLERESLRRDPAPSQKTREELTGPLVTRASGGCIGNDFDTSGGLVEVARTLPSRGDSGGLGTDFDLDGGVVAYRGGRVSGERDVAACLSAHGQRIDFEVETFVTHTLTGEGFDASEDGTGRGPPLVPHPLIPFEEQSPPLTGQHYGDNASREGMLVPFDETQITHPENRSNPQDGDPSPTLSTDARPPSIRTGGRGSRNLMVMVDQIRRLTPLEAERLMGFPDGWTNVEYRGKPAKDSPRYRSLGNSMAVSVMTYIGKRISMVEEIITSLAEQYPHGE